MEKSLQERINHYDGLMGQKKYDEASEYLKRNPDVEEIVEEEGRETVEKWLEKLSESGAALLK